MCGITGYWGGGESKEIVIRMSKRLKSRGPDDSGVWMGSSLDPVLAHRRLSIMDLSSAGHQPMTSGSGRYTIVYNGEIYNHEDLRNELKGEGHSIKWRGYSDTETLLESIVAWGVKATLQKLNGMFAFALWDAEKKQLYLARDRMGEKPLYYGLIGEVILFGSELKSLEEHPSWRGKVNRNALALYMRHNYVPCPWSIYEDIYKLPPAHFLIVENNKSALAEPICYWDLEQVANQGLANIGHNPDQLCDNLDSLLRDSINRRMVADVSLGTFLSGGYDSTTVAALMQAQSERPIKTFSIGFHEEGYNEAVHAKAVAEHLGTDHTELYIKPEEALGLVPELPTIYDEPFADSSQIPTLLVSRLARQEVTVSLSGDGGDELFCGYNRYLLGYRLWSKLCLMPSWLRLTAAVILRKFPGRLLDKCQQKLPAKWQLPRLEDRLPKLADVLMHNDGISFYRSLVSHWKQPEELVLGAKEPETLLSASTNLSGLDGFRERMMYLDQMTYLPDDILTKVDRASMAVSLEVRVPILDHRLVEFAWAVPTKYKYRKGASKWLLREVLYRYVPKQLMERPKMGFGIPIEKWLRNELREWASELLDEKRLRNEGFLDPSIVGKMWSEHLSGKRNWHYQLWTVLMFLAWLEKTPTAH